MTSMHDRFIRHPFYDQNLAPRFQAFIAPPIAPPGFPYPSVSAHSPLLVCPPPLPPLPSTPPRYSFGWTPTLPRLLQPPPPQSLLASPHSASSARNCGAHSCGLGIQRWYVKASGARFYHLCFSSSASAPLPPDYKYSRSPDTHCTAHQGAWAGP
jgi:hypothetical protein